MVKCARAAISEAYALPTDTHCPENRNRVVETNCHPCQVYDRLQAEEIEAMVKKHAISAYREIDQLHNGSQINKVGSMFPHLN